MAVNQDWDRPVINPYNFVSLGGDVQKVPFSSVGGDYTGVVHCRLRATTPLCIPDIPAGTEIDVQIKKNTVRHKTAPFFKLEETDANGRVVRRQYIITGSELRGVFRSAFETLSNGCLAVYTEPGKKDDSRDVKESKRQALLRMYDGHGRCEETSHLCPACRLFGMIQHDSRWKETKNLIKSGNPRPTALASRLRFTDAVCTARNPEIIPNVTLKELSTPRPNTTEFYTYTYNTLDYDPPKYEGEERIDDNTDLLDQWDAPGRGVYIRGRKFYFHNPAAARDENIYTTKRKTNRNLTTEVMKPGAEFTFGIYFERITEQELKQLVWMLAIGENNIDGKQQYKFGHGKPLGLGSAKVTVESVTRRIFDTETLECREEQLPVDPFFRSNPFLTGNETKNDFNMVAFRDFMRMTQFDYVAGLPVEYPQGCANGRTNSQQWFVLNHTRNMVIYPLPFLTDCASDQLLPFLEG